MDKCPAQSASQLQRSGRTIWWAVFLLAGFGIAGWIYRPQVTLFATQLASRFAPAKPTKPPQRIPAVGTAAVGQRDVPVYLTGLGTVTANKTVTVRSRVDGLLLEVPIAEGQTVQAGDVLALIDPRLWQAQLEQAEGQLARDQATLTGAKQTLARYQTLLASNTIASQQVDEQVSLAQQAEAAVRTDAAMIANARLQLEYCRVTAPISGRIGLRLLDAGNMVRANDPTGIAVITQLQPIALMFTIPQDDIAQVMRRSRQAEPLMVDVFDRDFRTKLASGKLVAVDNQVDSTTGTLRLKAVFDNLDEALFPNQFVNARLLVDTLLQATVVPSAALQRGPEFAYVYVLDPESMVSIRQVTPGITSDTETVIESGLSPGEIVVTDGLDKLQPGARVTTKTPNDEPVEKLPEGKSSPDGRRDKTDADTQVTPPGAKANLTSDSDGSRRNVPVIGEQTAATAGSPR